MERRKLLQMLGFTPTLALSLQGIKLHETKDTQYKGWTIKWSDWIPCMNQHLLVGRWVAMKEGESIGYILPFRGLVDGSFQDKCLIFPSMKVKCSLHRKLR